MEETYFISEENCWNLAWLLCLKSHKFYLCSWPRKEQWHWEQRPFLHWVHKGSFFDHRRRIFAFVTIRLKLSWACNDGLGFPLTEFHSAMVTGEKNSEHNTQKARRRINRLGRSHGHAWAFASTLPGARGYISPISWLWCRPARLD